MLRLAQRQVEPTQADSHWHGAPPSNPCSLSKLSLVGVQTEEDIQADADAEADAAIWVEGHDLAEFNGLYRRVDSARRGSSVYKKGNLQRQGKLDKYCYRCEKGDNRNNWFLNEEHTPAENRCAAYNDSVDGSLPTGRKIWHCHIGSEWLARTLTVTMMVRSNMTL